MKHTPGPWRILFEYNVTNSEGRIVASCGGFSSNADANAHVAENQANACLIAAAPDMYEALEAILFEDSNTTDEQSIKNRLKGRLALAKAGGSIE